MSGPINTPNPADDPRGFLVDLLSRYLPPGYVESLIRTWVPVGIGTALTWIAAWLATHTGVDVPLSQEASATVGMIGVGVVTAVYYGLARWVEKRWPAAGRVLISLNLVKSRPVYPSPAPAVPAVDAAPDVTDVPGGMRPPAGA